MFTTPPATATVPLGGGRPSRRHRRLRDAGFTIMEVAMATFVMAFGISTAIIVMQSGYRQIDLARGTTIAAQMIQSEMERLRMMNYSMICALPTSQSFDGATYFSSSSQIAGKYTIERDISNDTTFGADIKHITVSVTWSTFDGKSHTRSYMALYAKNGLYDYYYTTAHP